MAATLRLPLTRRRCEGHLRVRGGPEGPGRDERFADERL